MLLNSKTCVVGHRGFPFQYPENTLLGALAAIASGASAVEIDVQLTKDGVPVVLHDSNLMRVAEGHNDTPVYKLNFHELCDVSVHEPLRFCEKYSPLPLLDLATFCRHFNNTKSPLFIELKEESLAAFSLENYLALVMDASAGLASDNRIFISYSYELIQLAQSRYGCRCGWIISAFDEYHIQRALTLSPEIVVCDISDITSLERLRDFEWDWFLFDITDIALAKQCEASGVRYIESWNPPAIIG